MERYCSWLCRISCHFARGSTCNGPASPNFLEMRRTKQLRCQQLALVMVLSASMATTSPMSAMSQQFEFNEFHTWTDVATIYKFSDTFRYDGDYGIRGLLTDNDWTLIYLRPSVRYGARSWMKLHGGMALFYNFFKSLDDLPELRPWVGVRFVGPSLDGWVISNYLRLEYRAFYLKGEDQWDALLRGRWQIQVTTPRFSIGAAEQFFALASIEPFTGFGESINGILGERIRTNIGMGKKVTPALRVDLNYVFHKVRVSESGRDFDLDDHVLRLRFFYTVN
jgi:hypothetical protein